VQQRSLGTPLFRRVRRPPCNNTPFYSLCVPQAPVPFSLFSRLRGRPATEHGPAFGIGRVQLEGIVRQIWDCGNFHRERLPPPGPALHVAL
jgi:hypothetical protein